MAETDLLDTIKRVERSNYWFVRTDGGENFDAFYDGGYIAINWNGISIYDLKNKSPEDIKARILAIEEKKRQRNIQNPQSLRYTIS